MKYPERNLVQPQYIHARLKCVVMVIVLASHIVALDHVTCLDVIAITDAFQAIQKSHSNGGIISQLLTKFILFVAVIGFFW